jgi:type I restriction enzyme S subunit
MYPIKVNQDFLDPHFTAWMLVSEEFTTYADAQSRRARMPKLNRDELFAWNAPLPPLDEQKRIAAILNEQMEAVKRSRQATLAQLEAAIALPAAYLRTVFNSPEAQQWERQRLGNVLQLRKEVVHPRDNPRGLATFVGLEHIESLTGVRTGSIDVEMSQLSGRKPRFYKGDIVYGYLRPYLNKVWIADFDGLCSVDQYVYSVKTDTAETKFVAWFMRSSVYLKRAPINKTPGQLPRIRTDEVASVEINLPSLEEQQPIAANLTKQLAEVKHIQKSLESQLDAINKLPATLLRRAFNGEL